MARKRRPITKAELVHRLVPGLRPKLDTLQVRDLSLVHHVNLDAIRRGEADASLLWQWCGGVLTWSKVSSILQLGVDEMLDQAELARRVVERWKRTDTVTFDGAEYDLAVQGVVVMDELARRVDRATAILAADWSEEQINRMAAEAARGCHHATA
jgi:hypothetical protein